MKEVLREYVKRVISKIFEVDGVISGNIEDSASDIVQDYDELKKQQSEYIETLEKAIADEKNKSTGK